MQATCVNHWQGNAHVGVWFTAVSLSDPVRKQTLDCILTCPIIVICEPLHAEHIAL